MNTLETIPVVSVDSQDASSMFDAIRARLPLKAHGLTATWAASAWTFESLRALSGDRTVKALVGLPQHGGALSGGQEAYEQEMRFGAFLDHAESSQRKAPCYLGYTRPSQLIPGYDQAFDFSAFTPASEHATDTRLWIGSAGTCSGLHSDLKDNVFAQVHGSKRVYLVPLSQTHLVYPYLDNIVNSQVDPEHLDTTAYPRFLQASVYSTRVGPGDVLFIPRGWWHYLCSESPSISINHWFGPPIPARVFVALLARLGPSYVGRTLLDMVRYSILGQSYAKDFFFTPPATGERLFNLIRHGSFSRVNDPVAN
jgi:lysine-specific demethylase 8